MVLDQFAVFFNVVLEGMRVELEERPMILLVEKFKNEKRTNSQFMELIAGFSDLVFLNKIMISRPAAGLLLT